MLNAEARDRVVLVGPLAPPIGGVSSHLERLTRLLATTGRQAIIVDAYRAPGKTVRGDLRHELTPFRNDVLATLWTAWRLRRLSHAVRHLHFSKLVGKFALLGLLLRRGRGRLLLTLHNGDQQLVYERASGPVRALARAALGRMDLVIALSDQQEAFYRSLGLGSDRIQRWRGAPPLEVAPDDELLPPSVRDLVAVESGGEETILVTSGYPEAIYRYELSIQLVDQLARQAPCRLIICLYGDREDEEYMAALHKMIAANPRVQVIGALQPAGFLALLRRASLYLRPSLTDSYGLAISDALDVGTPCLASDVCNRDPRCAVFPAADAEAFLSLGEAMAVRGRRAGRKAVSGEREAGHAAMLEAYR